MTTQALCMPRLASPDPDGLPTVVTRTQALAAGLTPDQIRQRVRSGRWSTLAPGVYERCSVLASIDRFAAERERHRTQAYAAAMRHPGAVVGLESAAVLHGLPLVQSLPARPTLISSIGERRGDTQAHVYRRILRDEDVVELEPGLWVTTPLRTWLDVSRRGKLSDSLAVGDGALRAEAFTLDAALRAASIAQGRHCRLIRRASRLIDGRRETALESLSFARFLEWDVPLPEIQREIFDADGLLIGRVDFWWKHARVIGEADGRLKYQDGEALYAEKRREDALRALGFTVIRWGWQDLWTSQRLRWTLASALGNVPRVRGQAS